MSKSERTSSRSQRSAPKPQSDPRVVAVFHASSDKFVGLVARKDGAIIETIATREFGLSESGAAEWADQHLAARRIVVLPSASVIVRAVQLPKAPEDKLLSALELNATTFVLGRTPDFRVAAAILPGERGAENLRTGIVAEWPMDQPAPPMPVGLTERDRVSFAPEVAALAALSGASGDPLVAIDANHGAVSVAVPTSKGVLVRIVRAGSDEEELSADEIGRAVGEACVHSDVPAAEIKHSVARAHAAAQDALNGGFGCTPEAILDLSKHVHKQSLTEGAEWWRTYGVAAGTALAALGSGAALTRLQSYDPGARPDRAGALLNRMAEPKMASRLMLAAILVVILGPLAFQGVRLLVLQWKLQDVAAYEKSESTDKQVRAMYRILARNASSMTKTLSDVAAASPEGIEIDFINIAQGTNGQSVTVRGKAHPSGGQPGTEAILEMEQLMRTSGMFEGLTRSSEPPDQKGYQSFSISALAVRPTEVANYPEEQDYGKKTMKERRYGPMPEDVDPIAEGMDSVEPNNATAMASSARNSSRTTTPATAPATVTAPAGTTTPTAEVAAAEPDAAAADAQPTGRTARTPRAGSGSLATRGSTLGGSSNEPEPPPPPITEAEVSKMSKSEAQSALTTVSRARQRADLSDEVKARLRTEFDMLLERCKRD